MKADLVTTTEVQPGLVFAMLHSTVIDKYVMMTLNTQLLEVFGKSESPTVVIACSTAPEVELKISISEYIALKRNIVGYASHPKFKHILFSKILGEKINILLRLANIIGRGRMHMIDGRVELRNKLHELAGLPTIPSSLDEFLPPYLRK